MAIGSNKANCGIFTAGNQIAYNKIHGEIEPLFHLVRLQLCIFEMREHK